MARFPFYLLAAAALAWLPAGAGEFSVSPVRLEFNGPQRSQLLSITNNGSTTARFLARGAVWTLSESGAVELKDDDGIVVFPQSFTLEPKASQNVRVGTPQRPGDLEKTWRVILEELPDPGGAPAAAGTTITVLSMISVPVFLAPTTARRNLDIEWLGASGSSASVAVSNTGNVHALLGQVQIKAMRGTEVAQQAGLEGWYVLPGGRRVYALSGAQPWCAPDITTLELQAMGVQGQAIASRSLDARALCR